MLQPAMLYIITPLTTNWQHLLLFLIALYSTTRSMSVMVSTPATATSSPHPRLRVTRRRLLALHGLNLCIRWGYGVWWLLAKNPASAIKETFWLQPLESHLLTLSNPSSFHALLLADVLWIFFDLGFSADFWKALTESSTVRGGHNIPLIRVYHFADIFSRIQGFLLDSAIALALASLLNRIGTVRSVFDSLLPPDSGLNLDLLFFLAMYCLARAALRLLGKGTSFGQFFSGTTVICNDGQPLSMGKIISREVYALLCTSGLVTPFVVVSSEENASIVDLISDTREVDVLAFLPHKDGSIFVSSPLPSRTTRPISNTPAKAVAPAPVARGPAKSPATKTPAKSPAKPASKPAASPAVAPTTSKKQKASISSPVSPAIVMPKSTKKGTKRQAADLEDDSSEISAPPAKASKKIAKTPKKRATAAVDENEDDDEEEVVVSSSKAVPPSTGKKRGRPLKA